MARSKIEWTEATWNPTTGCDRTSPGCDNCYALTLSKRLKAMGQPKYQNDGDPRTSGPGFGLTCHEQTLDDPKHWRSSRTVFVNSMSDLFHPEVPEEFIRRVLDTIRETPQHEYQILTKRSACLAKIDRASGGRRMYGWASASRATATHFEPNTSSTPRHRRSSSAASHCSGLSRPSLLTRSTGS